MKLEFFIKFVFNGNSNHEWMLGSHELSRFRDDYGEKKLNFVSFCRSIGKLSTVLYIEVSLMGCSWILSYQFKILVISQYQFNPFTPKSAKLKTEEKILNVTLQNYQKQTVTHEKYIQLDSFHLNGHTLGFHPQTQKVQPHLLTQGLTLGVKGLNLSQFSVYSVYCLLLSTVFHWLVDHDRCSSYNNI